MTQPPKAYDLFRMGQDTVEISRILRISEAEALKQVTSQRSARLGKSDPYRDNELWHVPYRWNRRQKVKYLGQ